MTYDTRYEFHGHGGYGSDYRTPPPLPRRKPRTRKQLRMAPLDSNRHRFAHVTRGASNFLFWVFIPMFLFAWVWNHTVTDFWFGRLVVIAVLSQLCAVVAYIADGRWNDDDDDGRD